MTTALWPTNSCPYVAPRAWTLTFWRALISCILFSIIFLPEFVRDGVSDLSLPYAKVAGGFRFIDLAILFLVFCHVVALGCLRGKVVRFPRPLVMPGLAFLGCIAVAIAYGRSHGGSNFFFDWRGLALGIGLYFVWSFWLRNASDVAAALRVFAVYMAAPNRAALCPVPRRLPRHAGWRPHTHLRRTDAVLHRLYRPACVSLPRELPRRQQAPLVWPGRWLPTCSSCSAFGEPTGENWRLAPSSFFCYRSAIVSAMLSFSPAWLHRRRHSRRLVLQPACRAST